MTKKKRKIILFIVLGAILSTVFPIIVIFLLFSGFNDRYEITTDVTKYSEVIVGEKWEISEEIFPDSIEGLNVSEFKHVYYDPWDANYLAYLAIDYDQEAYQKELLRLKDCGIDEYIGYYSVTGFSEYELLAMTSDSYHGFVYAMTDGTSRIIYVELIFCNYFMDIDYKKQIPAEYLPDNFDASLNNPYQILKKQ